MPAQNSNFNDFILDFFYGLEYRLPRGPIKVFNSSVFLILFVNLIKRIQYSRTWNYFPQPLWSLSPRLQFNNFYLERWVDQHNTSVGQMSPWQESNPWPPEQRAGALSTELRELRVFLCSYARVVLIKSSHSLSPSLKFAIFLQLSQHLPSYLSSCKTSVMRIVQKQIEN